MRFFIIVLGALLMALGASTTRAEDYTNFEEVPSCVFGENGGSIRPQLLNVRPKFLKVNYVPKAGPVVRRHRRSSLIRP